MDHVNTKDLDTELDLERGLAVTEDSSKKEHSPGTAKQENSLLTKVSGGLIGGSTVIENRPSLSCNESNLNGIAMKVDVTKKLLTGQDSVDADKTLVKEKHKKASKKKAPKPPRPPRSPPLDAADQKLIRELSQLAMLKRTRIERMKTLRKMRASKSSSSSSSFLATVFTIIFFIVIIVQGLSSSGESSVVSIQGPPSLTGGAESGLISSQIPLNPSASHNNFVKQVAGSDLLEKLEEQINAV